MLVKFQEQSFVVSVRFAHCPFQRCSSLRHHWHYPIRSYLWPMNVWYFRAWIVSSFDPSQMSESHTWRRRIPPQEQTVTHMPNPHYAPAHRSALDPAKDCTYRIDSSHSIFPVVYRLAGGDRVPVTFHTCDTHFSCSVRLSSAIEQVLLWLSCFSSCFSCFIISRKRHTVLTGELFHHVVSARR